jgi:proline dehydrogenase
VERFLSADAPEVAEEAALALGNSRLLQAFALLQHCRERSAISAFKRMLLLPIDLTRCEEAFRLLHAVVRDEHPDSAAAAVKALSICGDNPERRELIREAALARNNQAVAAAHEKQFARADT